MIACQGSRFVFSNLLKAIPVVNFTVAPVVGALTAAAVTEVLGWTVAHDFYRISLGRTPENIVEDLIAPLIPKATA